MGEANKGSIIIIDTETTGVEVDKAGICQVAAVAMMPDEKTGAYNTLPVLQTYCVPSEPMSEGAFKVHGIGEEQYKHSPTDAMAMWAMKSVLDGFPKPVVLSGYNCTRYDYPLMDKVYPQAQFSAYPQIDVMTLMMREAPAEGLKLVEVFERITNGGLDEFDWAADLLSSAHDAMADCHMAAYVLQDWMARHKNPSPMSVAEWCNKPALLPCMPWGKYKGKKFDQVPISYLTWAKGAWDDMHPDLEYTMRHCGVG